MGHRRGKTDSGEAPQEILQGGDLTGGQGGTVLPVGAVRGSGAAAAGASPPRGDHDRFSNPAKPLNRSRQGTRALSEQWVAL